MVHFSFVFYMYFFKKESKLSQVLQKNPMEQLPAVKSNDNNLSVEFL